MPAPRDRLNRTPRYGSLSSPSTRTGRQFCCSSSISIRRLAADPIWSPPRFDGPQRAQPVPGPATPTREAPNIGSKPHESEACEKAEKSPGPVADRGSNTEWDDDAILRRLAPPRSDTDSLGSRSQIQQGAASDLPPVYVDQEVAEAERFRQETLQLLRQYYAQWESWRDNYQGLLQRHISGINPGFPEGWNPRWTKEEFDLHYLRRAMKLVECIGIAEDVLKEALRLCKNLGIPALDWQISGFSETGSDQGYPQSLEDATVAGMPYYSIMRWYGGLAGDARGGDTATALESFPASSARAETPSDVTVGTESDVQPGDSFSCVCGRKRAELAAEWRKRIAQYADTAPTP